MITPRKTLFLVILVCLILSLACGGGAQQRDAAQPGGGEGGAAKPGLGGGGGGVKPGPDDDAASQPGPGGGNAKPGPGSLDGGGAAQPGPRGAAGPGGDGIVKPDPGGGGNAAGALTAAEAVAEQAQGNDSATSNSETSTIIEQYARDVLGINVSIIGSESKDGTVNVPISTDSVEAAAEIDGVVYAAVLQGGAASVSLGDGEVSGDVNSDIQNASLGSYSFIQPGTAASDENSALSLVKSTFPGIADLPYSAVESSGGQGYNFMAQTQESEVDIKSGQAVIIAQVALVGVTSAQGQSVIYAVVGRGDYATALGR